MTEIEVKKKSRVQGPQEEQDQDRARPARCPVRDKRSRKGGGIPYLEYPQFQQLQAEETTRVFGARLIDRIIPLVEGLAGLLKKGTSVLDVGYGQGHHAINPMDNAFPRSNSTDLISLNKASNPQGGKQGRYG
jgi:hypothetical protein